MAMQRTRPHVHEEAPATAEQRDPQEFPFLPPRLGNPWSPAVVEARVRDLRVAMADAERRGGVEKHRMGSALHALYSGWAEQAKDYATFADFARFELGLSRTSLYELLRIATALSEKEAGEFGISRCLLGLRLLDLTGLQSFDALKRHPLRVETGDTVHFPSNVQQLRSAIRVLVDEKELAERQSYSRSVVREVQRLNRELQRHLEEDPHLEGLRARYDVGADGEPELTVGRMNRLQRKAFLRVFQKLVRSEG